MVRSRIAVVAVCSLILAACSSGSSGGSSARSAPSSSTTAPANAPGCAWRTKANKQTNNVAYPDTSATYWATAFDLAEGDRLVVKGRFPSARYISFISYGPEGSADHVVTDRDIEPDAGSTNPFRSGGRSGGRYTAQVPASGSGTVIYRVYLSKAKGDPAGGVDLPTLVVRRADGSERTQPPCAHPGTNPKVAALVSKNGPATDQPAPSQPVFIRPGASSSTLFPNPDNIYVATILHHTPGQVVVIRGKAPTFPNTAAGDPVTGDEQVRYWSLCTNEYRKPYPVSHCLADQDIALDATGSYTIVISTPEDRPEGITAAAGKTWLPWGPTTVDVLLLMRQMLPAEDFAEAAANVAPGKAAVSVMGEYAPRGTYCSVGEAEDLSPAGGCGEG